MCGQNGFVRVSLAAILAVKLSGFVMSPLLVVLLGNLRPEYLFASAALVGGLVLPEFVDVLDVLDQVGFVVVHVLASLTLKLHRPLVVVDFEKVNLKLILARENLFAIFARIDFSLAAKSPASALVLLEVVFAVESLVTNATVAIGVKVAVVALQGFMIGE